MQRYKRGDIVYTDLPTPANSQMHEQTGMRPVLIIQNEEDYGELPTAVVIPFTTQLKATRFASAFLVKPSSINGLRSQSVLLSFQIMAIDRRRLSIKLGELEAHYLNSLEDKVKILMNL